MTIAAFATLPRLKEVLWGSERLQTAFGKSAHPSQKIGESWEVSGLAGQSSRLIGKEASLDRLFRDDPEFFVGAALAHRPFPLLIKLLATSQVLSVQVHPNDRQAREIEGQSSGKWEAWVILEAEPGAAVFLGLAAGRTLADLESAAGVATSAMETVLRRVPVVPGQVIDVPPGTVHAIGPGLTLLEIQQPSDLTYRIHDWGRRDLDGQPRPLHLSRALSVADVGSRPAVRDLDPEAAHQVVLDHAAFFLEHRRVRGTLEIPNDSLAVLVALSGTGSLDGGEGTTLPLTRGSACLVPFAATVIALEGRDLELAICRPPRSPR